MALNFIDVAGWTNGPQMAKDVGFDGVRTDGNNSTVIKNAHDLGLKVIFVWQSSNAGSGISQYKSSGCTKSNTPYFELMNEPGLNGTSASAYAGILNSARTALNGAFSAGTAPLLAASGDGGHADPSGGDYLSGWLPSAGAAIDVVTAHPYGGSARQYGGLALDRARVLSFAQRTGKPCIVTEGGIPTGDANTGDSQKATETEQMGTTSGPAPSGQPGSGSGLLGWVQWCHDNGIDNTIYALIDQADTGGQQYGIFNWAGTHSAKLVVNPMKSLLASLKTPATPQKPTVTTTAPQGVTITGDTLTASVNPNQLSTVVTFDEGPTTAYGNHLTGTPNPVPAGTASVNVTAALTASLTAGSTRHVRASASNSQGSTVGNDLAYVVPTGAQPLQIKAVLNGADHSQILIQNIDPTTTLVTVAWTPANDANSVTYQYYSSPFPTAVTAPVGSPWGNVAAQDASSAYIGTYWDQAPGGGRVQTTPATGVAPTVTTAAASQITTSGALLAGALNSNNQGAGTGKFNYGTTTGYGAVTSSVPVSGSGSTVGTITFGAVNPGSTASGTSITIPATGANGTFQLGIMGGKGTGATLVTITPPSPSWLNFTGIAFTNAGGGSHLLRVYSKVAASEASSVWNFDQTQPQAGIIIALAGVSATSALRSHDCVAGGVASNTCTAPSVAAVTGDVLVYGGFFTNGDTVTFPSGTARQTVTTVTSATGTTLFVATEPIVADGLTGVRQISLNNTYGNGADTSVGFAVVVTPAVTAAGESFQVPVSGLASGTLYHCQAVGTTPGGTALGTDVTFTTAASGTHAPGVTWLTPTCLSAKGVTFAGQIDPGGASTTWKFQYRQKGDTTWIDAAGSPAVTVTGPVSKTVSPGLAPSTLYESQLSATNSAATTVSPINTFVTKDSGHHKFNQGDTVLVLDVSTPGAPDYLLGTTGLVDIATTSLITASFPTGDVVAFAPWALRAP